VHILKAPSNAEDEPSAKALDLVIELAKARVAISHSEIATKSLAVEHRLRTAYRDVESARARWADLSAEHAQLRARADAILASGSYNFAQKVAAVTKFVRRRVSRS
jgi:hypothetical protein